MIFMRSKMQINVFFNENVHHWLVVSVPLKKGHYPEKKSRTEIPRPCLETNLWILFHISKNS